MTSTAVSRFMAWTHSFGGFIVAISVGFAFLTVGNVVADPEHLQMFIPEAAIAGAVVGMAITSATKRRDVTSTGRISSLQKSLNAGKGNVDAAFAKLTEAQSALEDLYRDIERKAQTLSEQASDNAYLTQGLTKDEKRQFLKVQQKTNTKMLRATYLSAVAGWALGLISGALGWNDGFNGWAHALIHRLFH